MYAGTSWEAVSSPWNKTSLQLSALLGFFPESSEIPFGVGDLSLTGFGVTLGPSLGDDRETPWDMVSHPWALHRLCSLSHPAEVLPQEVPEPGSRRHIPCAVSHLCHP